MHESNQLKHKGKCLGPLKLQEILNGSEALWGIYFDKFLTYQPCFFTILFSQPRKAVPKEKRLKKPFAHSQQSWILSHCSSSSPISLHPFPYLIVAHMSAKPTHAMAAVIALVGATPMAWMIGNTAADAPAAAT
jgi:hypothetical protein